jgi:hypothetical protein
MLLVALSALTLASAAQVDAPPPPSIADRPHAALLTAIRGRCPPMEPRVRAAGPDQMLRLESGFRDQLPAENRSRLDQAQRGGGDRCGAGDASCQATAGLSAIVDSDLVGVFADYLCKRETELVAPQ